MPVPDPQPPRDRELKYAPGESAPRPAGARKPNVLEWFVCLHVGILLVWITWAFGGGGEWMRRYFAWWGGLGLLITLTALQDREHRRDALRTMVWLLPMLGFNALVLIGCANPSFSEIKIEGDVALAHSGGKPWLPSSARPALALQALALFDSLWLAAFNIAVVIRRRRVLRGLLLLAVLNAVALAVFGTVQKLAQASGIYFGAFPTRQPYFFSTFVYHNHWGAFTLLALAICLGLTWHYARRREARNFLHSPAIMGVVVFVLLAATIPLSGSRSCTLFLLLLSAIAFAHLVIRVVRQRRRMNESIAPPLLGAFAAVALAVAGIWYVGRDTIEKRAALTRTQVSTMLEQGSIGARVELYRNTWRMAADKPWFGWGMASYPHVFFRFYNTQSSRRDGLPVFYRDAHNDWLQALAEHGFVGCALLALTALVPLLAVRRRLASPLPAYVLGGCALLLLYAWLEFPFANLAVVLTWWLGFFCAIQYARLQDRDSANARSTLGTAPA